MQPQTLGKIGQDIAEKYFRNSGYSVLRRNWHSRYGEIDLILEKETEKSSCVNYSALIFCEIKTRVSDRFGNDGRFGSGEEAMDFRKRARMLKTIFVYLERLNYGGHAAAHISWQIDLICIKFEKCPGPRKWRVKLNHYKNI